MASEDGDRHKLAQNADYYAGLAEIERCVLALDSWWIDAFVKGPTVLELGCAEGVSTELLLRQAQFLDVVDGSELFCAKVRERFSSPDVRVLCELFEDYKPGRLYDDIVLARSLDYVADPQRILELIKSWLVPRGRLHLVVQNAGSLHRRLGVALGLMPELDYVSSHSRKVGHRRVYTVESLRTEVKAAGLAIVEMDGFFVKPLDYGTLEKSPSSVAELISALHQISFTVPDELCCQLYVQCIIDGP